MRSGRESETAVMVCMGRAAAHAHPALWGLNDPTALSLLPEAARKRVERYVNPTDSAWSFQAEADRRLFARLAPLMAARTLAIDAPLTALTTPQVVLLGAGLDGRAWRLTQLQQSTVFEVDHPDSQRCKRERVSRLTPMARSVQFVPVDFRTDNLEQALEAAEHRADQPTTWIWEGVVMYLRRSAIESTLSVVRQRSTLGSQLLVSYHCPAVTSFLVAMSVLRLGEPFCSWFTAPQMKALLQSFDFGVVEDRALPDWARPLSPRLAHAVRRMSYSRVVVAGRTA